MEHKYIDDLVKDGLSEGYPYYKEVDDPRQKEWDEETEKFGFDSSQTWSLDYTMATLLYERLMMFREKFKGLVGDQADVVVFKDKSYSLYEVVDELIILAKISIENDSKETHRLIDDSKCFKNAVAANLLWEFWEKVHDLVWW